MASKRKASPALGGDKTKRKQGNLFSFFSKKKVEKEPTLEPTTSTTKAVSPVAPPAAAARSSTALGSNPPLPPLPCDILVYWPDDDDYYRAKVTRKREQKYHHLEYYDDGHSEWIDLSTQQYKLAETHKKRRIQEDDDEEFEFDMDAASDEEEETFVPDAHEPEDDDDEEDQWMVTDDEEETEAPKKKKKAAVKVTQHKPAVVGKTPSKKPTSSSSQTPRHVTPAARTTTPLQQATPRLPILSSSTHQISSSPTGKAPAYEKNVVNPAGSHVHNHLQFLLQPRDAQRRPKEHPDYDPRTLHIDYAEWEQHCGKMTNAVQQWWHLKAQYYDTVLLFKTGKFYELFHMDADAGVQACNLLYMKGHVAHAGFPEISYGPMADQLVRAGYKVARVEQTETPQMMAERKKKTKNGPKVVNREVCSIMTLGTRTFCYLDESSGLAEATDGSASPVGPLLAIKEVLLEQSRSSPSDNEGDEMQPVCEYGVTLVDAVHGSVTIGQFADDVLRSRMDTLLATFAPSEILLQGGPEGASETLVNLIRSVQKTSLQGSRLETIQSTESFPTSTALDADVRRKMQRPTSRVQPWDTEETLKELHRRQYYPKGSLQGDRESVSRWPPVLKVAVEGNADLAISSFGAALFYLQRNLIDAEILSMGIVKAYIPPASTAASESESGRGIHQIAEEQSQEELAGVSDASTTTPRSSYQSEMPIDEEELAEQQISHMSLDGTTLHNLEVLYNSVDHKTSGSLWSKINFTKTPHGSRLLRAWLLRPLFRRRDIERRADAVEELVSGSGALALSEARKILSKCGDIERLLLRVHSMSGSGSAVDEDEGTSFHPNDRAILYEGATYTKRKVGDFSKVLKGLRVASQIPELFDGVDIQSGLLAKVVRLHSQGGCFPDMTEQLDWFFDNFDHEKAAKGMFEPSRGVDAQYDDACEVIERVKADLAQYKDEMCNECLRPRQVAKSSWKYANTKDESKDKYMIELPVTVEVPNDFILKGKRGSGHKQINKYRTRVVEELVQKLEQAIGVQKERKARGMQLIFAKFDSFRNIWAAAAQATALLDALGSLAQTSSKPGFTRPKIADCSMNTQPFINVVQGRHPCIERTSTASEFIPNDLSMGAVGSEESKRILLLSGPNMGGVSATAPLSPTSRHLSHTFTPEKYAPSPDLSDHHPRADGLLCTSRLVRVHTDRSDLHSPRCVRPHSSRSVDLLRRACRNGCCVAWSESSQPGDHGRAWPRNFDLRWYSHCQCDCAPFDRAQSLSQPLRDALPFTTRGMEGPSQRSPRTHGMPRRERQRDVAGQR